MDKKLPFTTPDGYFDSLRERVVQRCADGNALAHGHRMTTAWRSVRSQLAFAACFALLVGLAYFGARLIPQLQPTAQMADLADGISTMELESYLLENEEEYGGGADDAPDDDAIVDYLLCVGLSIYDAGSL